MKIKAKIKGQEVVFELQAMDGLDYYDLLSMYNVGRIKFSEYAQAVIKECVASPAEARDVKFFSENPKILDKIVFQCSRVSNVGLFEEENIEIIEE